MAVSPADRHPGTSPADTSPISPAMRSMSQVTLRMARCTSPVASAVARFSTKTRARMRASASSSNFVSSPAPTAVTCWPDESHAPERIGSRAPVVTVSRQIKRKWFEDDELTELNRYYGVTAQRTADAKRARRRKLVRLKDLRARVVTQAKIG